MEHGAQRERKERRDSPMSETARRERHQRQLQGGRGAGTNAEHQRMMMSEDSEVPTIGSDTYSEYSPSVADPADRWEAAREEVNN